MKAKDFFWRYFQVTGGIGAYLIYRELQKEEDFKPPKAVPDEE